MFESLSSSTNPTVSHALQKLETILRPVDLAWLKVNGSSLLCVDKHDVSLQYLVIFGNAKFHFIFEAPTVKLITGHKGFSINIQNDGVHGVPTLSIDYSE